MSVTEGPTQKRRKGLFRHVGPALILATVVIGPGSLTLSTIAGSLYGYGLLWVPVSATALMVVYTWCAARIGLVTGRTLFDLTRERFGSGLARVGGVSGFLAVVAFQAGNAAAVGFSAEALFGLDVRLGAAILSALALGLVFLPNLYDKLEGLVKLVVGLMLLTFVGTALVVGIDGGAALRGLVPAFPDTEALFLTLGMAATTFSVVAAVYQGYLMREKAWGPEHLASEGLDSLIGIGVLGFLSTVVLLTSAGALYGRADPAFSAQAMALQLEPLAGPAAFYLFTVGFFFASFSSLVVNPLIGATLLADGLGQDARMDGRPVKRYAAVAMAVGLGVVLLFRGSPVELLRIAQGLAVVAFPVLGFLVLAIGRDRRIMGAHATRTWVHGLALAGYLLLIAIALNYVRILVGI